MKKIIILNVMIFCAFVVNAQNFQGYSDATVTGSGFSYNVQISVTPVGPTNNTLYAGGYKVKLVSVNADSKGYYSRGKTNTYYSCPQLGSICNPNKFTDIYIGLNYECKNSGLQQIGFTRVNEEQTITMRLDPNTTCSFELGKVLVKNTSDEAIYRKRINEIEYPQTNNVGSISSSASTTPNIPTDTNVSQSIPANTSGNDPLAHYNNQQASNADKAVVAINQITNTLTPIVQNWADKREKAYNERKLKEEQKKDETRTNVIKFGSDNAKLYEQKALAGDVKAMVATGTGYCYTNSEKFYYWLKKAAALNNADAYFTLYSMTPGSDPLKPFYKDKTVEQDNWLLQAAQLGHLFSMDILWSLVYGSKESRSYNPSKAFEWLIKASENGHLPSMYSLGTFYEKGKFDYGFSIKNAKNPAKAIETYEALSKLNDREFSPKALEALSVIYEQGNGIKKNKVKAANYLIQADALRTQMGEVFYIYGYGNLKGVHYSTPFYKCYSAYDKYSKEADEARELLKVAISKHMAEESKSILFVYVSQLVVHNDHDANRLFEYKLDKAISEYGSVKILNSLVFSFDRRPDPNSLEKGVLTPIKAGW